MASPYKRVLLKLSGEILTESDNSALSESRLNFIASALKDALNSGIELAVVLGAGNIIRGATTSNNQLRRITADQMGMTATIINGLALCDLLNANGAPAHLFSAIELPGIVEKFNANRAQKLLANKTIVILCGGTGNPFVTTDSAASLRAIELDADILLKATKVDGIYSDDPKKNSNATLLKNLSYAEVLEQEYGVMDLGAFCQCRDYNMPIRVFNALKPNALEHALSGEDEGTLVGNSRSKQ